MATNEEILDELRTIRILLTIDKREHLQSKLDEFDDIQMELLDAFASSEWTGSGDISERLAKKHDVTTRTIRTKRRDLVESGFLLMRQAGSSYEYKKSGLARTIELFG